MTDAELYKIANDVKRYGLDSVVLSDLAELAVYVARYTDPMPLAECLERVAGERGGNVCRSMGEILYDFTVERRSYLSVYPGGFVYLDGKSLTSITTAGELHRLLDAMGVGRG